MGKKSCQIVINFLKRKAFNIDFFCVICYNM